MKVKFTTDEWWPCFIEKVNGEWYGDFTKEERERIRTAFAEFEEVNQMIGERVGYGS